MNEFDPTKFGATPVSESEGGFDPMQFGAVPAEPTKEMLSRQQKERDYGVEAKQALTSLASDFATGAEIWGKRIANFADDEFPIVKTGTQKIVGVTAKKVSEFSGQLARLTGAAKQAESMMRDPSTPLDKKEKARTFLNLTNPDYVSELYPEPSQQKLAVDALESVANAYLYGASGGAYGAVSTAAKAGGKSVLKAVGTEALKVAGKNTAADFVGNFAEGMGDNKPLADIPGQALGDATKTGLLTAAIDAAIPAAKGIMGLFKKRGSKITEEAADEALRGIVYQANTELPNAAVGESVIGENGGVYLNKLAKEQENKAVTSAMLEEGRRLIEPKVDVNDVSNRLSESIGTYERTEKEAAKQFYDDTKLVEAVGRPTNTVDAIDGLIARFGKNENTNKDIINYLGRLKSDLILSPDGLSADGRFMIGPNGRAMAVNGNISSQAIEKDVSSLIDMRDRINQDFKGELANFDVEQVKALKEGLGKDIDGILGSKDPETYARYKATLEKYAKYKSVNDKITSGLSQTKDKLAYISNLGKDERDVLFKDVLSPDEVHDLQSATKKEAITKATDVDGSINTSKLKEMAVKYAENGMLPAADASDLYHYAELQDLVNNGAEGVRKNMQKLEGVASSNESKIAETSQEAKKAEVALEQAGGSKDILEARTKYDTVVDNIVKSKSEQQFDAIWDNIPEADRAKVSQRSIYNIMERAVNTVGAVDGAFNPNTLRSEMEAIGFGSTKTGILNKLYTPEQREVMDSVFKLAVNASQKDASQGVIKRAAKALLGMSFLVRGNMGPGLYHITDGLKGIAGKTFDQMTEKELDAFIRKLSPSEGAAKEIGVLNEDKSKVIEDSLYRYLLRGAVKGNRDANDEDN